MSKKLKAKDSAKAEMLQEMMAKLPGTKGMPPKYQLKDGNMSPAGDTAEAKAENLLSTLTACGTKDLDLAMMLAGELANILPPGYIGDEDSLNGALAMLAGIKPTNELEGMLACQMVACHILSLETARRAMLANQSADGVNDNLSRMNKLMRTFTTQTEALQKLRGQTKTVTVKHVTVANGGQAVIGDIHHPGSTHGKN